MIELPSASTSPGAPPHQWWAVAVSGDLDIATTHDLDTRIGRAVSRHPDDGLVIDLSQVPFMDCSGVGSLMRARRQIGDRLCLRGVQRPVRRLLDLTEVSRVLRILDAGALWPHEADTELCRPVVESVSDHHPSFPGSRRSERATGVRVTS